MKDPERVAYDKLVTVLVDQIEYLRAQLAFTGRFVPPTAVPHMNVPPAPIPARFPSEEEEEIRHMHGANLIDDDEMRAALKQIGAMNTEILVDE